MFKINSSIDSKGCALNFSVGWLHVSLAGLDVSWVKGILKTLLSALHWAYVLNHQTAIEKLRVYFSIAHLRCAQ